MIKIYDHLTSLYGTDRAPQLFDRVKRSCRVIAGEYLRVMPVSQSAIRSSHLWRPGIDARQKLANVECVLQEKSGGCRERDSLLPFYPWTSVMVFSDGLRKGSGAGRLGRYLFDAESFPFDV